MSATPKSGRTGQQQKSAPATPADANPTTNQPAITMHKRPENTKKELRAFGKLLADAIEAACSGLDESQANHLFSILYYAHVSVWEGYSKEEQVDGWRWALAKLTDILSYAGEAYPIEYLDEEDPENIKPSATLDPARRERMLGKRLAEAVEKAAATLGVEASALGVGEEYDDDETQQWAVDMIAEALARAGASNGQA